jgi:hypothetical protein
MIIWSLPYISGLILLVCTLQRKSQFIYYFSGNCAASVSISTFMCLWAIYAFPRIGLHMSCSRIGRSIVEIFKSLTDTWMWILGLWPRNFFSGNICVEFSVLVLCSVRYLPHPGKQETCLRAPGCRGLGKHSQQHWVKNCVGIYIMYV